MRIAVIGGGLQGVETVYLAQKAGWRVTLVDREPAPPASGLCDRFVQVDITDPLPPEDIFKNVELIVPALENQAALDKLVDVSRSMSIPLVFDPAAYAVTRSKSASNRLFQKLDLPLPPDGRDAQGPVIVKPSQSSGSKGVEKFASYIDARAFLAGVPQGQQWICQQYLRGSMHSIEVIGRPGHYQTFAVTDLFMDSRYDCKRVQTPSVLSSDHQAALSEMARILAEELSLKGLMDVEVILCNDRLYLLEIDARIPSQTPAAVYWSTGANLVERLCHLYLNGDMDTALVDESKNAVFYEHLYMQAESRTIHMCGEHRLSQAGPLTVKRGWFGCDEAMTDADDSTNGWSATMVTCGENYVVCRNKRSAALDRLGYDRNSDDQLAGQEYVQ